MNLHLSLNLGHRPNDHVGSTNPSRGRNKDSNNLLMIIYIPHWSECPLLTKSLINPLAYSIAFNFGKLAMPVKGFLRELKQLKLLSLLTCLLCNFISNFLEFCTFSSIRKRILKLLNGKQLI